MIPVLGLSKSKKLVYKFLEAIFKTKMSFHPHVSVHGEMFRNFAFKFCQNLESWGWFETRGPWGEAHTKYSVQLNRIRESFSGNSNTVLLKNNK